ncbi:MAG: dihydrofolate reductase [Bacteroidales bacterium]|nr:dihydrofolate reductase [Bacteroidales bacterium]
MLPELFLGILIQNTNMLDFKYQTEQFADIRILRYQVKDFEALPIERKEQLYYLYKAALYGRDIIYDQNYKHNIIIRKTIENIIKTYSGDKANDDFGKFIEYCKRFWFSNGIHHHYSMDKFYPAIAEGYFKSLINNSTASLFPLRKGESIEEFQLFILPIIFDKNLDNKRVVLDHGVDLVDLSANNFYENVSQDEAELFYKEKLASDGKRPPSHGLNSKLVKEHGVLKELVWKADGMYSSAIKKMLFWLRKAEEVAENKQQGEALQKLILFYETGDLAIFDDYSIAWLKDTSSLIDVVNGFIEVYGDPLGKKATYESVVSIRDIEATKRAETVSGNAQWFEDNSSTDKKHKKEKVTGLSAKAINVVVQSGDCSPSGPIGINLPNAEWIREEYGSKSVTISNIIEAYDEASKDSGALKEFAFSDEEVALSKKWSNIASSLHVDLHEIIGHGSGKLVAGVSDPSETLKNYASTLEEARADLAALYFAIHPHLIELGLQPDIEVGYAEYNAYIRGGLMTQLVRVELGKNIEESHMRNRQLIAKWVFEKGQADNVLEKKIKKGKTYFVVNDYKKLRDLFGELLREVQRIKSEGDFEAGKDLVENYGVQVDYELHKEVLERWSKLNIAPYAGFINPKLEMKAGCGRINDVVISYPNDFMDQMLEYGEVYGSL